MSINEVKQELSHELIYHIDNLETLKQLILNGADVNYQNELGWCALLEAICFGNSETVSYLVSIGAKIKVRDIKGRNTLFWAIYNEDISMIKTLISFGIDLNEDVYPQLPALHFATYKNNISILDILLKNGVDIDQECSYTNSSAMIYACLYQKNQALEFLKNNGADMLFTDKLGNSPIKLLEKDSICLN